MRKATSKILFGINLILLILVANCFYFINHKGKGILMLFTMVILVYINILPTVFSYDIRDKRLKICSHGVDCLNLFWWSTVVSSIYHMYLALNLLPGRWYLWFNSVLVCFLIEAIIFWNGIISVYVSSIQLGINLRIIGIMCGWIPIVNLIVLHKIIEVVESEVIFESEKIVLNESREYRKICSTKYPILFVHGVFFRDFKYFNYWGRIPEELIKNGAIIYYGNHESAASVAECGKELADRIKSIVDKTGCEKVNVIAHSKGGLDIRYAVSCCGVSNYVASITTINTPHRGCLFADFLLDKISIKTQNKVATMYNSALSKLGDKNPNFLEAVGDLAASACKELNEIMIDVNDIFCQSVGSKLNKAIDGKFPLNFTFTLVKYFEGPNDGLVAEESFKWGNRFKFLTTNENRGISHGDVIDLNRENINGFDVREFYVQLVAELKVNNF